VGFPLVIQPSLDDLDAVEVGTVGIPEGTNHEAWRLVLGSVGQITAHGHTTSVSLASKIRAMYFIGFKIPTTKDPNF